MKDSKKKKSLGKNRHFANKISYMKSVTSVFTSFIFNKNMEGTHGILSLF